MKSSVFQFIASLERDLALFYDRLRTLPRLSKSGELFSFMSRHCEDHARAIERLSGKHPKPGLEQRFLLDVHRQIRQSLLEEVRDAEDEGEALQKISKAEELTGKLYQVIARHYREKAEWCLALAAEMDEIAEEECAHRDMVLRENRKY